ncbi:hypothetical protein GPECTOR_2g950 [Gonium pectorale]|uniref:Uncharacterized protein n=1 Tax=Gonium pectorale TaxID=33097 RepID=A0A150H2K8_GONPE|nr:hypothetical protein GPECTOR_2g950 [Gonium pectorale]|eukprot:KXZ56068.1 hypothetical protein GPECTOR_2g950 [Gonium pectorale]
MLYVSSPTTPCSLPRANWRAVRSYDRNDWRTAVQRNDWPEADSGVLAAYRATIPAAEGQEEAGAVRSWRAEEEWLDWPRFHAQLHVSYTPLLNCDSWRAVSPLLFPSSRTDNRAVQAVEDCWLIRGVRAGNYAL